MPRSASRYDNATIALHWLTAGLVIGLWGLAQVIDLFPSGAPRVAARSTHIALGVLLALVLAVRLLWRGTGGTALPPANTGMMGRLASAMHVALYVLVVCVVIGGIANTWVRGDSIYGLFRIPSFAPGDKAMRRLVGEVHELGANLILLIAGAHAAAALWHQYVVKDRLMARMGIGR